MREARPARSAQRSRARHAAPPAPVGKKPRKPPAAARATTTQTATAPRGRTAQKAATRAAVLDAARALFLERGVEATSVRDIAARANVAAGTVLLHGGTKEALVQAVFYDEIEGVFTRALDAAARLSTPLARLERVFGALLAHFERDRALSRALVVGLLFPPGRAGRARRSATSGYVARLAPLLEGGLRRGATAIEIAGLAFAIHVSNLMALLGDDREPLSVARRRLHRWLGHLFAGVGR
jgi:AcrR family transcriptional regulator